MSAAFKIAKKKLTQNELRKYMNDHKIRDTATKDVKKIQSPLAKYNENGQLTCILCQSIVRSEAVWTVHVNAKQHKMKVEEAKKLKERTNNFTTPLKRPLTPPLPDIPEKKVKGILKNGTNKNNSVTSAIDRSNNSTDRSSSKLPDDFFDSKKGAIGIPLSLKKQETVDEKMDTSSEMGNEKVLPEGFFDDPKQDAKARNQEYKDPIEEEWEKFVKAIKEADNQSNAIIAEDQEEATTERQIDEIDEQMKKLSRVLDLEKKKVEVISISSETKQVQSNNEEDDVDINIFDEFLDWREKKSFS